MPGKYYYESPNQMYNFRSDKVYTPDQLNETWNKMDQETGRAPKPAPAPAPTQTAPTPPPAVPPIPSRSPEQPPSHPVDAPGSANRAPLGVDILNSPILKGAAGAAYDMGSLFPGAADTQLAQAAKQYIEQGRDKETPFEQFQRGLGNAGTYFIPPFSGGFGIADRIFAGPGAAVGRKIIGGMAERSAGKVLARDTAAAAADRAAAGTAADAAKASELSRASYPITQSAAAKAAKIRAAEGTHAAAISAADEAQTKAQAAAQKLFGDRVTRGSQLGTVAGRTVGQVAGRGAVGAVTGASTSDPGHRGQGAAEGAIFGAGTLPVSEILRHPVVRHAIGLLGGTAAGFHVGGFEGGLGGLGVYTLVRGDKVVKVLVNTAGKIIDAMPGTAGAGAGFATSSDTGQRYTNEFRSMMATPKERPAQ